MHYCTVTTVLQSGQCASLRAWPHHPRVGWARPARERSLGTFSVPVLAVLGYVALSTTYHFTPLPACIHSSHNGGGPCCATLVAPWWFTNRDEALSRFHRSVASPPCSRSRGKRRSSRSEPTLIEGEKKPALDFSGSRSKSSTLFSPKRAPKKLVDAVVVASLFL